MADRELADATAELREALDRGLREGFSDPDDVLESAVEYLSDDHDADELRAIAERLLVELVAAHRREQASWPAVTDCDRLDAAFAELDAAGVTARQNFSCCGNCGCHEIGDEMAEATGSGVTVRGYTFYHMQDTENAADGGGLYLNYGAAEPGDAAGLAVGAEVAATLARHGLSTEWDGSLRTRIHVSLDWKRRPPAEG